MGDLISTLEGAKEALAADVSALAEKMSRKSQVNAEITGYKNMLAAHGRDYETKMINGVPCAVPRRSRIESITSESMATLQEREIARIEFEDHWSVRLDEVVRHVPSSSYVAVRNAHGFDLQGFRNSYGAFELIYSPENKEEFPLAVVEVAYYT